MSHGPRPGGGGDADALGDEEGDKLGVPSEVGDAVGVGVPLLTVPVQVVPLSVNDAGVGLELPFQEPLNPKLVLAPVPRDPLYDTFVTVTFAPKPPGHWLLTVYET